MGQIDRISGYVGELGVKAPCNCATTAAITLYGEQTVDGYDATTTDNNNLGTRVLVKNQPGAIGNGIYYVNTGAWTLAGDFNNARAVTQGTMVYINSGTTNGGSMWQITTPNPINPGFMPGTTAIEWALSRTYISGGPTTSRPIPQSVPYQYFDETLNIPIWCTSLSPLIWVNAAGVQV